MMRRSPFRGTQTTNQNLCTFQGFVDDLNAWSADTFQTFVKGRQKNTVSSHIYDHHLPKNKIRLYTHHGQYSTKSKELRSFTHSRQKGCPAYVILSGSVKTGLITVKFHEGHNHKLLEEEWQHHRENRKLGSPEKRQVH